MNDLQATPEWRAARLGKLTASRIADATARTKTGWGASRANYMAELLMRGHGPARTAIYKRRDGVGHTIRGRSYHRLRV